MLQFHTMKNRLSLDPTNENSYLNLVALILEGEQDIVDQMNSLGTSRSDNLKYDELKEVRENLYKECVPILQDLISINNNVEAIRTLMNIYGTIGRQFGLYGDEKSFGTTRLNNSFSGYFFI